MLGSTWSEVFQRGGQDGKEATHSGADHHCTAGGRGRSGPRQIREADQPGAGHHRADVLPVEAGVRRDEGEPGTAPEGARARERAPEASSGGLDTGQADPGGSGRGKLLSPERRRRCVVRVRQQLGASERRACRVLGQPRTTQRRARKVASDEGALRGDIVRLASRFGRYGYRRVTDMLRIEGWGVNHKRVERIWRQEGLKVPQRQPKRGRLWLNDGSCIRLRPLYRGHVWSYDFVASRTHDGRALKLLTVLDEHTRECLAIVVARKIRSHDVLEVLADLVRPTRASRVSEVGQRTGVHREARAAVVGARGRRDALYRAGQPVGERLQRELQRQAQGRAVERGDLLLVGAGGRAGRAMEARVQYRPTPQRLRRLSPGP